LGIPATQGTRVFIYILRQLLKNRHKFSLVLMLEPLFTCNLNCPGCGKRRQAALAPRATLDVADCIGAALECGAPVVSIAGGEPLLHPHIDAIAAQLVALRRYVYLCSNGILVSKFIDAFEPSPRLIFNIHLDGMRERHDSFTATGVFDQAVQAIRLLKSRGFRVTTNTTVFLGETVEHAGRFFDFLTSLGVEGMTVAPGFNYETAPGQGQFLTDRKAVRQLFQKIFRLGRSRAWRFNHSSLYLDFLAGGREYACTPWGNPTFNLFGWQRPCYLLNESYAESYSDLLYHTGWEAYGPGRNPQCASCMVHCGFEPSAVLDAITHPFSLLRFQWRKCAGGCAERLLWR
jgi:hopanoid biosynthesis associated radical SAM protein HpnH